MLECDFIEIVIIIFAILSLILLILLYYKISKFSFWSKLNIDGPIPIPIFGNFYQSTLQIKSLGENLREIYRVSNDKQFIGLYHGLSPALMVNDPNLIKEILIKDFASFADRGFQSNENVDPMSANLFLLDGDRWKGLRTKLTPAFTSGKLKIMYQLLIECANKFEKYFSYIVMKGESIEVKEITAKFTTDVIGSCVFGINMNALNDEEKTISLRKKNGIFRNDFVDLLMEIKKKNSDKTDFELTDELIAAQAFVFFLAGFETSSTTMTMILYELAQNMKIQKKLRAEIRDSIKKHDGELPYESIKDLKYLDKVFKETLRKHPPLTFLVRRSTKSYTIPKTNIEIPVGTKVFVSLLGLHYDPKYFLEPEIFDPERFSDQEIRQRPQMVYLPFGDGPRNCIGLAINEIITDYNSKQANLSLCSDPHGARFANYQTKIGVIKIIKEHEVSLSPKTKIPYVIHKTSFTLSPVDGMYLNFKKIV